MLVSVVLPRKGRNPWALHRRFWWWECHRGREGSASREGQQDQTYSHTTKVIILHWQKTFTSLPLTPFIYIDPFSLFNYYSFVICWFLFCINPLSTDYLTFVYLLLFRITSLSLITFSGLWVSFPFYLSFQNRTKTWMIGK